MDFARACGVVAALVGSLCGCASGFEYRPAPASQPPATLGPLQLSVEAVLGPDVSTCQVMVGAKNVGKQLAVFDPDALTIRSAGGTTLRHSNKFTGFQAQWFGMHDEVWDFLNVAFPNPLLPGAELSAAVWFPDDCPPAAEIFYGEERILRYPL